MTEAQIREIATQKMPDLNASSVEAAMKMHPRHRPLHGPGRGRLTKQQSIGLTKEDVWSGR